MALSGVIVVGTFGTVGKLIVARGLSTACCGTYTDVIGGAVGAGVAVGLGVTIGVVFEWVSPPFVVVPPYVELVWLTWLA